jgi:flagellar biosynthesis/type III secretory pathway protein FliH
MTSIECARFGTGQFRSVVKADPELERGDFMIETSQTHLDGRVRSQLDAIGRTLFDE